MKKYITDAIVLRNINYRDSNKIYTFLSRDLGKISALGRGVRKISSRRAGNLDTLNVISVSITEDSKGFKSIDEAKTVNSFKNVKKSLNLISEALQMVELVNIFIDNDQITEGIFELLYKSLVKLDALEVTTAKYAPLVLAEFELRFMALNGYELTLDRCTSCSKILDATWETYWFSYAAGGISCPNCRAGTLQLAGECALILRELDFGSSIAPKDLETITTKRALDIVKTHVETVAENFYRKPKVAKMLYT